MAKAGTPEEAAKLFYYFHFYLIMPLIILKRCSFSLKQKVQYCYFIHLFWGRQERNNGLSIHFIGKRRFEIRVSWDIRAVKLNHLYFVPSTGKSAEFCITSIKDCYLMTWLTWNCTHAGECAEEPCQRPSENVSRLNQYSCFPYTNNESRFRDAEWITW